MTSGRIVLMSELSDIRYDARVLKQANTLAENGFIVHLIMYNSEIRSVEKKRIGNIDSVSIPFPNRYKTGSIIKIFKRSLVLLTVISRYFYYITKIKADYYHAHNFYVGWIVYVSSLLHKGKFIYDAHEIQWEDSLIRKFIGTKIESILLKKALLTICPSQDRSRLISDFYKLKKMPVVLHNYPSLKINQPGVESTDNKTLHKELKLSPDTFILFYSGMFSIHTRLQYNVIKALPLIPENSVFVIIGFGHDHEIQFLKSIAENYKVEERVYIMNPVPHDKLLNYTRSSDVGISLLKNNRISFLYHALNKFYEYTAAGISVLASDFSTFREDIYNNNVGQIGATCNEEDPVSIAESLNYILEDKNKLNGFKKNSEILFKEHWNWENDSAILLKHYGNI